ncbi:putative lipid II flippase FtsW [Candidatus Falkowbacteria bacterium]|nr:putative lipid II flippase FtsW [Candidatus Falkowbacteria bacterium]
MRQFALGKRRKKNLLDRFIKPGKSGPKPDNFLLIVIFIIIVFGLIMLSSASSNISFRDYEGNSYHLFWRQILRGFLPGLLLFWFFSRFDYQKLEKFSVSLFFAALALLVLVFVPGLGQVYGGSRSWLGFPGFSFQPAEFVKLFLILALAGWFSYRGREMNREFWNGLAPFAFMLVLIGLPIIFQPDIGTLVIITVIALVIYYVAGAKLSHITGVILAGIGAFGILIIQAPYRLARLVTFINPDAETTGAAYQINQALLAVGSGGLFGLGFGQSRQKLAYLPEVMGDSIFAIIAEELGFIFVSGLIILFLLLAWRGFKIAGSLDDPYGKFIIVGILAWFIFQAFLNIGAMIGILPLTGVPLPFISYGATALASSMAAAGILVNISRRYSN